MKLLLLTALVYKFLFHILNVSFSNNKYIFLFYLFMLTITKIKFGIILFSFEIIMFVLPLETTLSQFIKYTYYNV